MPITEWPTRNDAPATNDVSAPPLLRAHARPWRARSGATPADVGPRASLRSIAMLRIAFGLVWAIDATLKWLPGFRESFPSMLDNAATGQPGWLDPWFDLWTCLPHREALVMAYGAASTETIIAVGLVTGFARKSIYLLGVGYTVLLWATGEGFGGPYQSGSTDVGTAIIYTFVFAALLLAARSGPDPYSVDFFIERRVPWWPRIAEVGSRWSRYGATHGTPT